MLNDQIIVIVLQLMLWHEVFTAAVEAQPLITCFNCHTNDYADCWNPKPQSTNAMEGCYACQTRFINTQQNEESAIIRSCAAYTCPSSAPTSSETIHCCKTNYCNAQNSGSSSTSHRKDIQNLVLLLMTCCLAAVVPQLLSSYTPSSTAPATFIAQEEKQPEANRDDQPCKLQLIQRILNYEVAATTLLPTTSIKMNSNFVIVKKQTKPTKNCFKTINLK